MFEYLYLDEKDVKPKKQPDAKSNGFYEESCINDFPIREYRTVVPVRHRRWKDVGGKSVSKDWQLVAKGTRYSKEFAAFIKRIPWIHPRLQPGRSRNPFT